MAAVYDARDAAARPRGGDRLPPAADLDHPAVAGEALVPARPAQAPVHAVLAHLAAASTATSCARVSYSEPAGDLIPVRDRKAPFSAGDAPEAHRP